MVNISMKHYVNIELENWDLIAQKLNTHIREYTNVVENKADLKIDGAQLDHLLMDVPELVESLAKLNLTVKDIIVDFCDSPAVWKTNLDYLQRYDREGIRITIPVYNYQNTARLFYQWDDNFLVAKETANGVRKYKIEYREDPHALIDEFPVIGAGVINVDFFHGYRIDIMVKDIRLDVLIAVNEDLTHYLNT